MYAYTLLTEVYCQFATDARGSHSHKAVEPFATGIKME